ncbi:MAG: ABC transporter ATP-binding protein [Anaerolineales bacterium]|nr:ABC transporter ATP-binding protein [Anaerolineales bacterium]
MKELDGRLKFTQEETLVEVRDLKKWYPVQTTFLDKVFSSQRQFIRAVDGVSFDIHRGEVFGLAGESGSGKTTTGRAVLRLTEPTAGTVRFNGIDLRSLDPDTLREMRRWMQVIFQDPMASLNPRMSLGESISQGLKIHFPERTSDHREITFEMMRMVGLTPAEFYYSKFPHQISGGQRQRVVIARALVTRPDLILADEPIAMADVSVRVLLLDLMKELKDELDLTYLFITHDLATARHICDRIGIMYLGRIVEIGELKEVYTHPLHPYTRALLAAVPVPDPHERRNEPMPEGEIPNPINPPSGCRFHPRCLIAQEICSKAEPLERELKPGHFVACHFAEDYL